MSSNIADIWTIVLRKLQTGIVSDIDFDRYLKDSNAIGMDGRVLRIGVRNQEAANWLRDELANDISRILRQVNGDLYLVVFEAADQKDDEDEATVVWDSILNHLQMEMPRASFDTWVRDTIALSLEGGMLTIGVRNMYARDWLDSRLKTAIKRLLAENLNRNVEVNFVVKGADNKGITDENAKTEERQIGDTTWFEIQAQYTSIYDAVVKPDSSTPLPGYFFRHLPRTGVEVGCLYFAFKQVTFLRTSKTSGSVSERFHIDALVDWCGGMSRRTVLSYLSKPKTWEKLEGLVRRDSTEKEWDKTGGAVRRLPVKYTVELSLPLTPADAESLTNWFRARLHEGKTPEAILDLVLEVAEMKDGNVRTGLEQLIPLANNYTSTSKYHPMHVKNVLEQVFGEFMEQKTLLSYSVRLEKLIMPSNDLIMVSNFFAKNVWPHLNPGPGWLVVIGKDKTFKGLRDTFIVEGGYAEIARWLGFSPESGSTTVRDWFTGVHTEKASKKDAKKKKGTLNRKGGRKKQLAEGDLRVAVMHIYLSIANEQRRFGGSSLTIKVFQEDLPFEIFDAALFGGMKGVEYLAQVIENYKPPESSNSEENNLLILSKEDGSSHFGRFALSNSGDLHQQFGRFAPTDEGDLHQQIGEICTIGLGSFALSNGAICTNSLRDFALSIGEICTTLSSLNSDSNSKTNSDKTITNSLQQEDWGSSQFSVPNVWNLETLLKIGKIGKEDRKKFFQKYNKSHLWPFLTRLLYAVGPQGNGIKAPAYWAISRMDSDEFDLPEYRALAKLAPRVLVMLAYKAARGQSFAMDPALVEYSHIWKNAMGDDGFLGEKVLVMLLGRSPINSEIETVREFVDVDGNLNREIEKRSGRK